MKGRNGRSFVPRELKPFFLFRSLSVLKEKRFPSFLPLYGNRNEVWDGVRSEYKNRLFHEKKKEKWLYFKDESNKAGNNSKKSFKFKGS
jgi:hypothetical protein